MADNVVTLAGGKPANPGEPNPRCVEELERLLEAARAGEIVGIAGSYMHRNHVISYSYAGRVGGFALVGGLEHVQQLLLRKAANGG